MRTVLPLAFAAALLSLAPVGARAAALDCGAWDFTEDGGYEGGEVEAYITCYAPGSIIPSGLSLGCAMTEDGAVSLKAYPLDDVFQPEGAAVTYTVGDQSVTLDAVFQGADGSFLADGDADLLALLASAEAVTVAIEGAGDAMTLPLGGAAGVIEKMQVACAPEG